MSRERSSVMADRRRGIARDGLFGLAATNLLLAKCIVRSPIMGLFNRKKKNGSDPSESHNKKEKGGWKRPASANVFHCLSFILSHSISQIRHSSSNGSKLGSPFLPQRQSFRLSSSLASSLRPLVVYSYGVHRWSLKSPSTIPIAKS